MNTLKPVDTIGIISPGWVADKMIMKSMQKASKNQDFKSNPERIFTKTPINIPQAWKNVLMI